MSWWILVPRTGECTQPDLARCVFYGDLYGTKGENPQEPVSQLEDLVRARKLFAYGEQRDYWDHGECWYDRV